MKKLSEIAKEYEGHTVFTQKAADVAGVPLRTLQDWCRNGLLDFPGQGTGHRREFNIYDIILIGICKSLTDQGLRPKVVRSLVFHLTVEQPNILKKYLRFDECFVILPTQDKDQEKRGVISGGTTFAYFNHDKLPNALEVMQMMQTTMDVGRDTTIVININRISKRILKNASGEIG